MSWYVEHLLMNAEQIRELGDIQSDEFNDLIILEKKFDEMIKSGLITDSELYEMNVYLNITMYNNLTRMQRITFSDKFCQLAEKLAIALGGIYTDDGWEDYMVNKYQLNLEQLQKLTAYMRSRYRHKLVTKREEQTNG